MGVFTSSSYRTTLREQIKSSSIPLNAIAEQTRIHPSYLSRALLSKASLSNDQLFRIVSLLKLGRHEIEYLMLLRDYEETGDETFREFLRSKLDDAQTAQLKLSKRLTSKHPLKLTDAAVTEYYQNAATAAVHMYLCVDKFRTQPQLIAKRLDSHPEGFKKLSPSCKKTVLLSKLMVNLYLNAA